MAVSTFDEGCMLVAMVEVAAVFCGCDMLSVSGCIWETAWLFAVAGRLFGKLFLLRWL